MTDDRGNDSSTLEVPSFVTQDEGEMAARFAEQDEQVVYPCHVPLGELKAVLEEEHEEEGEEQEMESSPHEERMTEKFKSGGTEILKMVNEINGGPASLGQLNIISGDDGELSGRVLPAEWLTLGQQLKEKCGAALQDESPMESATTGEIRSLAGQEADIADAIDGMYEGAKNKLQDLRQATPSEVNTSAETSEMTPPPARTTEKRLRGVIERRAQFRSAIEALITATDAASSAAETATVAASAATVAATNASAAAKIAAAAATAALAYI